MFGYLIDPSTKTVTQVPYNGDYKEISAAIGCEIFDIVRIDDKNTIFVDDEGLINGTSFSVGMFRFDGDHPAELAGRGLVLGIDEEGESVSPTWSIEDISRQVSFLGGKLFP